MVQYAVVAVEQESRAAVGNNVGFMEMLEELRKPCTVGVKRKCEGSYTEMDGVQVAHGCGRRRCTDQWFCFLCVFA